MNNIELEPFLEEHLNDAYLYRNELFKNFRQSRMITWKEHLKWFENLDSNKELMYAISDGWYDFKGVGGLCNLNWYNRSAEISLYLGCDEWFDEYAKDALVELLKINFNQLNFHKAWAEIFEFNHDNINLFKNLRFKYTGKIEHTAFKNGKYIDGMIYSLLEDDFRELEKNNFRIIQ